MWSKRSCGNRSPRWLNPQLFRQSSAGNGYNLGTTVNWRESIARWYKKKQAGSLCYFTHRLVEVGARRGVKMPWHIA
jgi:hypothetical protein